MLSGRDDLPFCSIVLPALNEARYIRACLEALNAQDYPADRREVIVVDNGSTDDTAGIARSLGARVYVVPGVRVGAVRNFGARQAQGEILVFIDSDCVVNREWLSQGVSLLGAATDIVLGGALKNPPQPSWIEKYWLLEGPAVQPQQRDLMGSCIFIRKGHFMSISGFDESLSSGEDTELSLRLKHYGFAVEMKPELAVIHLGNPSTVADFLRRQIWHAENYVQQPRSLIGDKVFLLVLLYLGSLLGLMGSLASGSGYVMMIIATQIPPSVLSLKRIRRARYPMPGLPAGAKILAIDNLYLLGRAFGLLKCLGGLAVGAVRPAVPMR